MAGARLKCIYPNCGLEYPVSSVMFRCENGHPMDVIYDEIPHVRLKDTISKRRGHLGNINIYDTSGVWRFRELFNFCQVDTEDVKECAKRFVSLDGAEGRQSGPYHMKRASEIAGIEDGRMLLQTEGYNPSGSFKDNGMVTAVTHARMTGARKIICASTGNTSASAGMIAANEGMECDVYIPAGQIAPGKLSQAYQFGAQIIEVEGNFDDAFAMSLHDAQAGSGYTVNSINPFRIEGQKTIPYRALEYLGWKAPDWIVYPGGAMGNTSSCGKAMAELYRWGWIKKMPRIAVINAEGASAVSDMYNGTYGTPLRWNGGQVDMGIIDEYYAMNQRPTTMATAIQIGRPTNILKGIRALDITNGVVTTVSDAEMLDAMSVIGLNGFDCEMASGAALAGIKKLIHEGVIKKDDMVVGILTGRQKDPTLAVKYHNDPSNRFARPPRKSARHAPPKSDM